ncbi:MAG: hypothetical protein K2L89_03170 [Muribaculaceae bacterium]|nr:hypothetical protein [Muribaculaceae bacterium]
MEDKDISQAKKKSENALDEKKHFNGYTIEELRYQRALVALQKEFCKSKVLHKVERVKNRKLFGNDGDSGGSKFLKAGSIASKLLRGMNYLDYAMIGMSLFGSGKKIYKFLKGKKK